MNTYAAIRNICIILAMVTVISPGGCAPKHRSSSSDSTMGAKAAAPQMMFDSPQAAVDALVDGARRRDRAELRKIFGPEFERLTSGDKEQDDIDLQVFVVAYDVKHSMTEKSDGAYLLAVGEQEWVFPAPIVPDGQYWYFDTSAGVDEVITRTISENEFSLIEAMDAFVATQEAF